jgi:DNA-binding MarR family transcriptional regulator
MEQKKGRYSHPAFLLAQVGAHAAAKFGERLATLRLTPPDAGILRMLGATAGVSQQELSVRLGLHPSRLVAILDELESRGLIERRPNAADRRQYALHLSSKGNETLSEIGRIGREHQDGLCASLSGDEREKLGEMLSRIAEEQGLTPGVHPGYRRMKRRGEGETDEPSLP